MTSETTLKENIGDRNWHALTVDDALEVVRTDTELGLSAGEVEESRKHYGVNELTRHSERTTFRRLLSQFNNLFIILLLAAAAVTAGLGEWLDSGVILGVVIIIVFIGFVQEGRAARSLEAVQDLLAPEAKVLRAGQRESIPAGEVVVGDVVLLEAGDRVPVDVRLVETKNLQAQEAALTGESTAVEKNSEPVDADAELGNRTSMAFAGTVITAGEGSGVSVAVGDGSEIGRISGMLADVEDIKTPLMQRVDSFAKVLSIAILGLAALTFAAGVILWSRDWDEMFFAAVAIAVAAIPEGLPAVMTVTLALGVQRMAARSAIIRRLPAVETLGSVTIVCSDKTGTLTRNEMTVKTVRTAQDDIEVEGVGYQPEGQFRIDGAEIELADYPVATGLIQAGMLCNDASVGQDGDEWKPDGDPTEAALMCLRGKPHSSPKAKHRSGSASMRFPSRRSAATWRRSIGAAETNTLSTSKAPRNGCSKCARTNSAAMKLSTSQRRSGRNASMRSLSAGSGFLP